jgi:hypothetical protein
LSSLLFGSSARGQGAGRFGLPYRSGSGHIESSQERPGRFRASSAARQNRPLKADLLGLAAFVIAIVQRFGGQQELDLVVPALSSVPQAAADKLPLFAQAEREEAAN